MEKKVPHAQKYHHSSIQNSPDIRCLVSMSSFLNHPSFPHPLLWFLLKLLQPDNDNILSGHHPAHPWEAQNTRHSYKGTACSLSPNQQALDLAERSRLSVFFNWFCYTAVCKHQCSPTVSGEWFYSILKFFKRTSSGITVQWEKKKQQQQQNIHGKMKLKDEFILVQNILKSLHTKSL